MELTRIYTKLSEYPLILKKIIRNTDSPLLLRRCKKLTEKENIVSVEDFMLPEILRIQA
jgi:ribosomal-protein-alanine N-acetyltransferase